MTRARRNTWMPLDLGYFLSRDGWKTPDTYATDEFGTIPERSGVYLFVGFEIFDDYTQVDEALYVGMSTSLRRRTSGHPIRGKFNPTIQIQTWFREFSSSLIRDAERHYIRLLRPKFNIIGRIPGDA